MAENLPTREEWRKLYEAGTKVKEMAPWEWMRETDIFGVQSPDTEEPGFVSVMGMLGEHYAVAVYLGAKGLYDFWELQDTWQHALPERVLEIPQLQASFMNRQELDKQDYDTIKKLGLRFRGKNAWPEFRSLRPGFAPWFLEAEEARLLRYALEQTVDVASRFRDNPSLLNPSDDESYLVRIASKKKGNLTWEDRIMQVPPPEPESIPRVMDVQILESLKGMPKTKHRLEIDVFMFPAPVREKGTRSFFPYTLLIVEAKSGMVLNADLLQPLPSLNSMRGLIPVKVFGTLIQLGTVPQKISVRSELLFNLLQPVTQELGIKLKQARRLRSLDAAKQSMFQFLM